MHVLGSRMHRRWFAAIVLLGLIPGAVSTPSAGPAGALAASTLSIVMTPLTSGTAPFETTASCIVGEQVGPSDTIPTTANVTGTSHCPGMDHSGDPTLDRIVRTNDTINFRIDWAIDDVPSTSGYSLNGEYADTNLVIRSTLPLGLSGQPAAVWTAVPTGCYTSSSGLPVVTPLSSVSNNNRTLTCNVGHRETGSTGNVLATAQTRGFASDGVKLDFVTTFGSGTTRAAALPDVASATESFWSSAAPKYNLRADAWAISSTFPVLGPSNELGRLMGLSVGIPNAKGLDPLVPSSWGGGSTVPTGTPLSFDVDLSQFGTVAATDGSPGTLASRARLHSCSGGSIRCTQSGGVGTPIHVDVYGANFSLATGTWVWSGSIGIWLPNAAIPTTSTALTARISNFDPNAIASPNFLGGRSNYGGVGEICGLVGVGVPNPANCEPGLVAATSSATHTAANDNSQYATVVRAPPNSTVTGMFLMDRDIRAGSNVGVFAAEPSAFSSTPISYGHGYSEPRVQARPGATFQSSFSLGNNGGSVNTSPMLCNKWDNRTLQLTDFGDATKPIVPGQGNAAFVANTWSVVNTAGIGSEVWHPGVKWDRTAPYTTTNPHNLQADPAWYVVEFGVGEYSPYAQSPAAPAQLSMRNVACRDADSPAGWFTNPKDPAIQTWINATFGSTSGIKPIDVVNKVRVRLLDPLLPAQYVDATIRLSVRSDYGLTAVGLAGSEIPVGTRLATNSAFTDSYFAPRTGSGYLNGWYIGSYDAGTDAGSIGDRLTLSMVDTRSRVYSLWNSPTSLNATYTVIAGQDLWWRLDTTASIVLPSIPTSPVPAAVPLRAVTMVSSSLTYVPGSGCRVAASFTPTTCSSRIDPSAVVPQSDGSTLLVWDLGNVVPSATASPISVVFRTTTDQLTNTGSLAVVQSISESRNTNGISNDAMPACVSSAAKTNRSIPATANGPSVILAIPTVACGVNNSYQYRHAETQITINNAASIAVSGRVGSQQIEVGEDDDGTFTKVAYRVTVKNFDSTAVPNTDVIVILPHNGDGRVPPSSFSGTIKLQGVATTDTLSTVPNPLPSSSGPAPGNAGTTIYYNAQPPNSIKDDPNHNTNLAGNGSKWCLASQFGTSQCPSNLASVTAVRAVSGSLGTGGASRTLRLRFETNANRAGDLYTLRATHRTSKYVILSQTPGSTMVVVDSQIGDTLWDDSDGDGIVDSNEPGRLSGVRVELRDSLGVLVASTTTDSLGMYLFSSLRSGTYTVTVVNNNGIDGVANRYPAYSPSYDADNATVGGADGNPNGAAVVVLGRGQPRVDIDFGYFAAGLSGTVWNDSNTDGFVDSDETFASDIIVALTGTNDLGVAVQRTATTDILGGYVFSGLRPGTYSLSLTNSTATTFAIAGSEGGTASGGVVSGIALNAGRLGTKYQFALQGLGITGRIFTDVDDSGDRTDADEGSSGIAVSILVPDGRGGVVSGETTTDALGDFSL